MNKTTNRPMDFSNYGIIACVNYSNSGPDWDHVTHWDDGYTLAEAEEMVEYLNERGAGHYCYKVV